MTTPGKPADKPLVVALLLGVFFSSMLPPILLQPSAFAAQKNGASYSEGMVTAQFGPGTSNNKGFGPLNDPPNLKRDPKTATREEYPEIIEITDLATKSAIDNAPAAVKARQLDLDTLSAKLPVHFVENRGQSPQAVRFEVTAQHHKVFLTSNEVVFAAAPEVNAMRRSEAIRLKFEGASPSPAIEGTEMLPGKFNYFIGNDPSKWKTDVPSYKGVAYKGLYKGVDLVFKDSDGQIERDFVISPGVEPSVIRMKYGGARKIHISKKGELVVEAPLSVLTEAKPDAYQNIHGKTVKVAADFRIGKDGRVAFGVGDYDRSQPLIIDPVFRFSTLVGGNLDDRAFGLAVDATGIYLAGQTTSINFPATGSFGPLGGGVNEFALKLALDGSSLIYSDIIGGSSPEAAIAAQVHPGDGTLYILGVTTSADFPTTVGAFDTSYNGNQDYHVARINAEGNAFVWSTYIGGDGFELGLGGIDVYNNGDCWIVGGSSSLGPFQSEHPYPVVPSFGTSLRTINSGSFDGVATAIRFNGASVVTSGFWGGTGVDQGSGVAINRSEGDFYYCGFTTSADAPVCTSVGVPFASCQAAGFDITYNGSIDAHITRFSSLGNPLGSTFLGDPVNADADDTIRGITFDEAIRPARPNVYVAGYTNGPGYPTTPGAFDASYNGGGADQVVTKFNPTLSALSYSTFIGGSMNDLAFGIAVNSAGNAYVTGYTGSTNFPVFPPTSVSGGGDDATITKLNSGGSALLLSQYIGGSGADEGIAIRLNSAGTVATIGGITSSFNFPTTAGAFDTTFNGVFDAFVTQVDTSADICIQDDSNGNLLLFNSSTGEYQFTNCAAVAITGIGTITRRGGIITLQHYAGDRKVVARIDTAVNKASAGIQIYSQGTAFTITDRDTTNDACACQ